jgi:hypothetical protein
VKEKKAERGKGKRKGKRRKIKSHTFTDLKPHQTYRPYRPYINTILNTSIH